MKLVVLNYPSQCVEVYDLTEQEADMVDSEDWESPDMIVLSNHGVDMNNCHWMFVDDDVEIFVNEDTAPTITL